MLVFAMLAGPALGERDVSPLEERIVAVALSADPPWTIMVIRLRHAKAEELAATLRRVLPPDVKVVPDVPTNSLIVSVPSASPVEPIDPE